MMQVVFGGGDLWQYELSQASARIQIEINILSFSDDEEGELETELENELANEYGEGRHHPRSLSR